MLTKCTLDFPLGSLDLSATDKGLVSVQYNKSVDSNAQDPPSHAVLEAAYNQLQLYFSGDLQVFSIPLDTTGHSHFHLSVWEEVRKIPYGATCSYLSIAESLNNPGSVRAVGSANGRNPWPIIIPCHRVVGSNGSLTGYAYGLDMKQWLLNWEWQNRKAPKGLLF